MKLRDSAVITGLVFITIFGLASVAWLLRVPSEESVSFLWGYSLSRLIIAVGLVIAVSSFAFLTATVFWQPERWQRVKQKFSSSNTGLFIFLVLLCSVYLGIGVILLMICWRAKLDLPLLKAISDRLIFPLLWVEAAILGVGLYLGLNRDLNKTVKALLSPLRLSILLFLLTIVYTVELKVLMAVSRDSRMTHMEYYIFLPATVLLVWAVLNKWKREKRWTTFIDRLFPVLLLGAITFSVYCHTAQWVDWQVTPDMVYWNDLAEAILQGRLYLIDPSATADLTMYNGNWYVPNPPLPA